ATVPVEGAAVPVRATPAVLADGPAVVATGATVPVEPAAVPVKATSVAIEAPTSAPVAIEPAPVTVLPWRRRGQRSCGGRLALRGGPAQLGSGRGQDARRLGAHAQDAPAAGCQDLEVEVVEPDAEGLTGQLQGLLDGLAGEFLVRAGAAHLRLPRRPCRPRWRIVAFAETVLSRDDRSGLGAAGAP